MLICAVELLRANGIVPLPKGHTQSQQYPLMSQDLLGAVDSNTRKRRRDEGSDEAKPKLPKHEVEDDRENLIFLRVRFCWARRRPALMKTSYRNS